MALALHLGLGFVHSFAKALVDLFVNAVLVFIPDEIGDIVNGGFKIMIGLPKVLARFHGLLPAGKAESQLLGR